MKPAFESDWFFLRAALPDLESYLLSKEIYWPLGVPARSPGGLQIPQLTIGSLLLSQARLSVLALDATRRNEFAGLVRQLLRVREEWRANWSRKAGREAASRLKLWDQYLHELRSDPRAHAAAYANQARQRAILNLLAGEILDDLPQAEAEQRKLTGQLMLSGQLQLASQLQHADSLLRGLFEPGPFLWEPEVERAFAPEDYWFLYGTVRK